ncbi:MAG: methyltransferase [Gammaproteobacteria bacterium]|nr:methyltransferase [Gammaproteobacteria bacterium]
MNPELPAIDDTPIWNAMLSVFNSQAITVALELEVFEGLTEPASVEAISNKLGYSQRGMKALLPMLKVQGLLDKHKGEYQLNNLSRAYMLKDSPYYWGPFFIRRAETLPNYKMILENIRDGETVEARGSADGWESGQMDPELAKTVTDFMHCHSITSAVGLAHTCDFSGVNKLLDVGGGSGCYASALANHYPELRCTIMELSAVCDVAKGYIAKAGVSDRVDTKAVDMFRADWPEGYNAHFFSNIFHDWTTETCEELAQKSYDALEPGGRICLQEILFEEDGDGPYPAAAFSFFMAQGTKGQQYTLAELESMLVKAGFKNISCQRSYGYYSLVTAYKA